MTGASKSLPPRMIYVVEAENGLFKVGNSRFYNNRIAAIAACSACRIRLVAVWAGEVRDEQVIHARLDAHREHHEWFRKEGAAGAFFETVFGRGVAGQPQWAIHDRPTLPGRRKVMSAAMKKKWQDPAYRAAMMRSAAKPTLAEVN